MLSPWKLMMLRASIRFEKGCISKIFFFVVVTEINCLLCQKSEEKEYCFLSGDLGGNSGGNFNCDFDGVLSGEEIEDVMIQDDCIVW